MLTLWLNHISYIQLFSFIIYILFMFVLSLSTTTTPHSPRLYYSWNRPSVLLLIAKADAKEGMSEKYILKFHIHDHCAGTYWCSAITLSAYQIGNTQFKLRTRFRDSFLIFSVFCFLYTPVNQSYNGIHLTRKIQWSYL